MFKNVGQTDRIIRMVLGFSMAIVGINFGISTLGFFHMITGFILALTGALGFSPIYYYFKFSTKGSGIDKITTSEIKNAVREHPVEIKKTPIKKKLVKTKTKAKKKTTIKKKATKKKVVKKVASKKTTNKKPIKKVTTKKKITNKKK